MVKKSKIIKKNAQKKMNRLGKKEEAVIHIFGMKAKHLTLWKEESSVKRTEDSVFFSKSFGCFFGYGFIKLE